MDTFIALCWFLLSLTGVDVGGSTFVHRDGGDGSALHSRATVQAGVARFECLASASGECHYLVYARDCGPGAGPCPGTPAHRFSVAAGASHQLTGLHAIELCVGGAPDAARDCRKAPVAAR